MAAPYIKSYSEGYGRTNRIQTPTGTLSTPALIPICAFIGGTTVNCGGLWKYLRKHLFAKEIPLLSEITHFVNFRISGRNLQTWRSKTFHEWFPDFKAPLFLDSGGFQLLNNKELGFEKYGLTLSPPDILKLQVDFGADVIATLDYPIAPNLRKSEATERMNSSIGNCLATLRILEKTGNNQTKVFVPVHGRTPAEVKGYIQEFLSRYKKARVRRQVDGFAIGSLVPIRNQPEKLIPLLMQLKRSLREAGLESKPVHAFGVASSFIPYLIYLGFDTFDSSTYVQNARNLRYADPATWMSLRATKLDELTCGCETCGSLDVKEMRGILTSDVSFQSIGGRFKSEFYADIAAHNLNLQLQAVSESIEAMKAESLEEYLLEFTRGKMRTQVPLELLGMEFTSLQKKLGRTVHPVPDSPEVKQTLSLKYKQSDFVIPETYRVPKRERILVLFPCSKEKPYSESQTFKRLTAAISSNLNGLSKQLHYVVLSGLYGPVPLRFENLPQTLNYDFVLSFRNEKGIKRIGESLNAYIKKHSGAFDHILVVAASKPYRDAAAKGLKGVKSAKIFPEKDKNGRYNGRAVQQLQAIEQCVDFLMSLEDEIHRTSKNGNRKNIPKQSKKN